MIALALALARPGHEVRLLTPARGERSVDLQSPLWLHKLDLGDRSNLEAAAAYYHEVTSLNARGALQLVVAPLATGCGLLCVLDRRSPPTVVLPAIASDDPLEASILELEPLRADADAADVLLSLERARIRASETSLRRRLGAVIARAEGGDQADYDGVSRRLLDSSRYPIDFRKELLAAWRLGDDDFVEALYRLVTGAQPDPASRVHWAAHLAAGRHRSDVLSELIRGRPARGLSRRIVAEVLQSASAACTPTH